MQTAEGLTILWPRHRDHVTGSFIHTFTRNSSQWFNDFLQSGHFHALNRRYVVLRPSQAYSRVRNEYGLKLEGESTDNIWNVIDIAALTDFPYIRQHYRAH